MTALTKTNNKLTTANVFNRWRSSYHGQSVLSPFHAVALAVVVGLTFIQPWWALAVIPTEAVFGWLLPRTKAFRKAVDEDRKEEELEAKHRACEAMLCSLLPEFRYDVERFTLLADAISHRVGCDAEICFHIQELIKRYLHLASVLTDYRYARRALGDTIKEKPEDVDTLIYDARGGKRQANLDAAKSIEKEMSDISELMELAYEHAIAPEVEASDVCQRFLDDLEENKDMVKSLVQVKLAEKMVQLEA